MVFLTQSERIVRACAGHISVNIIRASDRLWPPTLSSSCLSPAATKLEQTARFNTTSQLVTKQQTDRKKWKQLKSERPVTMHITWLNSNNFAKCNRMQQFTQDKFFAALVHIHYKRIRIFFLQSAGLAKLQYLHNKIIVFYDRSITVSYVNMDHSHSVVMLKFKDFRSTMVIYMFKDILAQH